MSTEPVTTTATKPIPNATGPRTPEGKSRSRNNAWRHGLTGQVACMPHEDRDAYEAFRARIIAALQPEGDIENQLAHDIAEDRWRIERIRAIETNMLAIGSSDTASLGERALSQAAAFLESPQSFALLSLYESRMARKISRNEKDLKALQSARQAAYDQALQEAELLAQLALDKGEDYAAAPADSARPLHTQFVFSQEFLCRRIERKQRLTEARALFQPGRKPALRRAA